MTVQAVHPRPPCSRRIRDPPPRGVTAENSARRGERARFQSGMVSSGVEACPSTVTRIGNAARVSRGGREAAGVAGRTARTVNLGLISPDAFSPPYPLLFEATMPRLNARSDARDGGATSSDIRTRYPALETRVSASACTHLRGNAMRWGSAIGKGQNLVVRRTLQF